MIKLKACIFLWVSSAFVQTRGKQCNYPALPMHTERISPVKDTYEDNTHFYYRCAEGYQFKEHGTDRHKIRCDDGHWNPTSFWKCLDKCNNHCGAHGKCITTIGSSTGDTVTSCQCDRNYAGNRCDGRVCEMPNLPIHHLPPLLRKGARLPSPGKYSIGSEIVYRCKPGYEIKRGQLRPLAVCRLNGWFPTVIPQCEEKTCQPVEIFHGLYEPKKSSYKAGEFVKYSCEHGFKLHGGNLFSCSSDGNWNPSSKWPSCESTVYLCGSPPDVLHATRTNTKPPFIIGSEASYTCGEKFWLEGKASIDCKAGGWEKPPHCYSRYKCGSKKKIMVEKNSKFYCVDERETGIVTRTVSTNVKPLTIVTATAGALLLLLLVVISLVAYQRRRIALNNRRQGRERLNHEDDRYSFVYYSNDVHLVLPSYDEAMRVQGSQPPPYHYVTEPTPEYNSISENGNDEVGMQGLISGSNGENVENIYDVIDDTHRNRVEEVTEDEPLSTTVLSDIAASNFSNEHDYSSVEKSDYNYKKKVGTAQLESDSIPNVHRGSISSHDSTSDDTLPLINN